MADVVWRPDAHTLRAANVSRLMRRHGFEDYWGARSPLARRIPEWFWPAAIEDMGLDFATPWNQVMDLSRGPEWATWFVGSTLSIAWNCVHRWAERDPERGRRRRARGGRRRAASTPSPSSPRRSPGSRRGSSRSASSRDRVAIYMPMCPEVAVASHACAHIGAVQVPIFSGFAAPAVRERLQDSEAKVVVTADWSLRARQAARHAGHGRGGGAGGSGGRARRHLEPRRPVVERRRDLGPGELPPLEVDSEHPYLLTYTSGTTGKPKGVLHVQGGFLVSIGRELAYQADAHPDDVIHFATDMGWIMGPWTVVGGGAMGAKLVFAEGAPDYPADRLWRTIEAEA